MITRRDIEGEFCQSVKLGHARVCEKRTVLARLRSNLTSLVAYVSLLRAVTRRTFECSEGCPVCRVIWAMTAVAVLGCGAVLVFAR